MAQRAITQGPLVLVAAAAAAGDDLAAAAVARVGAARAVRRRGAVIGEPHNLTVSVRITNLLNHANLAAPIGNVTSPRFDQSTRTLSGFGGGGGGFGGGGNAGNRRIELQMRFSF
ncbi:MAG: hypothetical protein WKF30_17575 [Pyrinomonadaceae bacterium]